MTVILYAVALLLLWDVSESSCYRIKRGTNCFNGKQDGLCVPISDCEELAAIRAKELMVEKDVKLLKKRKNACDYLKSSVTLYCCYNPSTSISTPVIKPQITTTGSVPTPTTTTETIITPATNTESTTEAIKKYESFVPKACGSHTAKNETFGWTVLIGTGHFYRRCVGTLINNGFVLTAAHCVYGVEPNDITLYFGSIKVVELPQCESSDCQQTGAENIWIHEDFEVASNAYNVALIKTTLNIKHQSMSFINPICLPLNTTEDDTDPAKMHILRPLIYNTSKSNGRSCDTVVIGFANEIGLDSSALALIANGLQEACGYWGAPIVVVDRYKLYQIVGVANHPVDCDRKRVKRDATLAMEYVEWILNVLTNGTKHEEPWA